MKEDLIGYLVRFKFNHTRKERVEERIRALLEEYLLLCERANGFGCKKIKVPKMMGVDEDMRGWSLYMILEHNTIVNKNIRNIVKRLERGEELPPEERIDPKRDVMPAESCDREQVADFEKSVEEYLEMAGMLKNLKGTRRVAHPVFGDFDAHQWHCMFAFHLNIHLRQAEYVVGALEEDLKNEEEQNL